MQRQTGERRNVERKPPNTLSGVTWDIFKCVMDSLTEGVFVVDTNHRVVYWNEGARQITGRAPAAVLGCCCGAETVMHRDRNGNFPCKTSCPLNVAITDGTRSEHEMMLETATGEVIPVIVEVMPVRNESGEVVGAAQIFRDHSRYYEAEQRLAQMKKMAMEDPVTLIGNRRSIQTVIEARFREYERYGHRVGVIFADVNNFKQINDTWGHETGDRVLAAVADQFRKTLRKVDTIGRWGGDEFVCVVPHTGQKELDLLAGRIRMNVRRIQVELDCATVIRPSISIGTAVIKPDDTPETLIRRADLAMYENKRQVREYCFGKG